MILLSLVLVDVVWARRPGLLFVCFVVCLIFVFVTKCAIVAAFVVVNGDDDVLPCDVI